MTPAGLSSALALVVICGLTAAVIRLSISRRRIKADLATTRRLFADCMDLAPFCAYIKNAEGRYIYENPALAEFARTAVTSITSFLDRTDLDVFPAAQARRYMDDDREVLRQGKPIALDNDSFDTDGAVRKWFTVKFPWVDEEGRVCVAGMSVDVSEVRRAQATAKINEDRCALAIEAGHMGTFTLDLTTHMLDTSPLFATLHGRPDSKTRIGLEESLADVHSADRPNILAAVQAALQDEAPSRIAYRVGLPDGGVRWIELTGRVFTDDAGRPTVVRGVAFDVTEQRTAYEELTRRKEVLRRLIDVQENERQTICHDLHDGLIQYAIGAKMQLESARDEADATLRAERIDAALDCLERGIAEGRQVIRGVRPAVLDDLGLTAALEDLAEQMATAGVTVETSLDEGLDDLPPQLRTTIYRVVQESLTNARKHAGTDRATVEIRRAADEVVVRVSDRGAGFDVEESRRNGFGVVGMTERVRLAGGRLRIESRPGAGTQVDARLPMPAAEDDASVGGGAAAPYAAAEPRLFAV